MTNLYRQMLDISVLFSTNITARYDIEKTCDILAWA